MKAFHSADEETELYAHWLVDLGIWMPCNGGTPIDKFEVLVRLIHERRENVQARIERLLVVESTTSVK